MPRFMISDEREGNNLSSLFREEILKIMTYIKLYEVLWLQMLFLNKKDWKGSFCFAAVCFPSVFSVHIIRSIPVRPSKLPHKGRKKRKKNENIPNDYFIVMTEPFPTIGIHRMEAVTYICRLLRDKQDKKKRQGKKTPSGRFLSSLALAVDVVWHTRSRFPCT